jgi:hypothetical protein
MNKYLRLLLFLIAFLTISFSACQIRADAPETGGQKLTLDELLACKKGFVIGKETAEQLYDKEQTADKLAAFAEYAFVHHASKPPYAYIGFAEASEDLDAYFGFLKDCYAGYMYFGGDLKFRDAKADILANVPREGISAENFEHIIRRETSFVEDAHFVIGPDKPDTEKWAVAKNMYFRKDENGIFNIDSNKRVSFTGGVNEGSFKPTLNNENEICLQLFAGLDEDIPKTIIYEDGTQTSLNWTRISANMPKKRQAEFRVIDGIPYLKFDQCYFQSGDAESADALIDGAKKLADSKFAILDLRGNNGGDGVLPGRWFETYSGNKAAYSCDGVCIMDHTIIGKSRQSFGDIIKYFCPEPLDENHYACRKSDGIYHKEGLLIVLIDGCVASAGEYMVDLLHHLSNTLFVGMPTCGALRGSAVTQYNMEHSGILVSFGNIIMSYDPAYFKEYVGFMPDIWMPSPDVDRIADLLNSLN